MSDICRWGILGSAHIAQKNWKAIRNSGNGIVAAVGSRDVKRAKQFIDLCQADCAFPTIPDACGSYEELLARKDIDAVYIPLPTGIRKEWVVKAAQAGKHIVCEKPCGADAGEVREMLDACHRAGVQFMDGVMFMHSDRLPAMRQVLDDGRTVGNIKRIASQFSFLAPEEFLKGNIRVSSELEPLGCLGDLGWYTIRFSLWAMNYKLPHTVTGRILSQHGRSDSQRPVPTEFSAELLFDGGVSASFYNSFLTEHQCWANVSGTKGYLYLQDFVLPFFGNEVEFFTQQTFANMQVCDFNIESHHRRHAVVEYATSHPTSQETKLFRTFANCVLTKKVDPFWGDVALKTQIVMDACLASAIEGKPVTIAR